MVKSTFLLTGFAMYYYLPAILFLPSWGFYGHRLINKMAVFTLPEELFGFYKQNIDYLSEHAVDPDKRRYASRFEANRHFIDLDIWNSVPGDTLPLNFYEALSLHADYQLILRNDTMPLKRIVSGDSLWFESSHPLPCSLVTTIHDFSRYWNHVIEPMYYEDDWLLSGDDLDDFFRVDCYGQANAIFRIQDRFSQHGILPYHLQAMQKKLTYAFIENSPTDILRLSAEMGHYIGDAHVPLHTTENYNGQKTGQTGIHAFWESTIPELLAEEEYSFFMDSARYIPDKAPYFMNIIHSSHQFVAPLLAEERRLSLSYPNDKKYCYDNRLGRIERMYCPEYVRSYSQRLGNMVESQMKAAIQSLGDCIYTAWVDAGQPSIGNTRQTISQDTIQVKPTRQGGGIRPHE